jgi:hypothetical protein
VADEHIAIRQRARADTVQKVPDAIQIQICRRFHHDRLRTFLGGVEFVMRPVDGKPSLSARELDAFALDAGDQRGFRRSP